MANLLCKSTVLKLYQEVIGDVITNIEEIFTEDGVDNQILQQLKQTWEAKLMASKAVETRSEAERIIDTAKMAQKRIVAPQNVAQVSNVPVNQQMYQVVETKMVQIQIKLPVDPSAGKPAPVLTVQIPQTVIERNQLQKVLTGNLIASLLNLSPAVASSVLQQHINATFLQAPMANKILQGDGNYDSSEDEDDLLGVPSPKPKSAAKKQKLSKTKSNATASDLSDDDILSENDSISEESESEKQAEVEVDEGEPLNSDDDVSEEEQAEFFDVENVVVCQYDKITRNRNKWKFHMKAGIMNLNGQDYIFEKINGEAEW